MDLPLLCLWYNQGRKPDFLLGAFKASSSYSVVYFSLGSVLSSGGVLPVLPMKMVKRGQERSPGWAGRVTIRYCRMRYLVPRSRMTQDPMPGGGLQLDGPPSCLGVVRDMVSLGSQQ